MMVFDAVHIPRGLKVFNKYVVNKFKFFLDTLDIIVYFYVCVVLLSVLFVAM